MNDDAWKQHNAPNAALDSSLSAIIDALSTTSDVPQALARVLSLVTGALGLEAGWIWLADPETAEFYSVAAQNLPPFLQDPGEMTGSTCWCIEAFRQHKLTPDNIDIMQCSRLTSARAGVDATHGLRCHVTVPLYFQDRPIGIMNVAAPRMRSLLPEELKLLSTVSHQAGLAVERGRLAEEKARLARAEERTRIARDIHDTLAQGLAAIILHIEAAVPHLETNPDLARRRLQKALKAAQDNLDEARRSVLDLRATALDGKPLAQALRSLGRSFASETGIRVTLNVDDIAGQDSRIETEFYRIAQEALTNVRRHAQAKHVEICLEHVDHAVILAVTDDGIGFRRSAVRPGAHGLTGMRERARLIGASLRIATAFKTPSLEGRAGEGFGTRLLIRLPIVGQAPPATTPIVAQASLPVGRSTPPSSQEPTR